MSKLQSLRGTWRSSDPSHMVTFSFSISGAKRVVQYFFKTVNTLGGAILWHTVLIKTTTLKKSWTYLLQSTWWKFLNNSLLLTFINLGWSSKTGHVAYHIFHFSEQENFLECFVMHTTILFYQTLLHVHMSLPFHFQGIYNPIQNTKYTYITHTYTFSLTLTHMHTYTQVHIHAHASLFMGLDNWANIKKIK